MNRHPSAAERADARAVTPENSVIAGEENWSADFGSPVTIAPPWAHSLLAFFALLVGAAVVLCFVCRVEVTDRAPGIVRPSTGVRPLLAQADGVVSEVYARSGDRVSNGTPLVRLQSAETDASLLEATRELELQQKEHAQVAADPQFEREREALMRRLDYLHQQITSLEGSVAHQEKRMKAMSSLQQSGLVSPIDADEVRDRYQEAIRSLQSGRETLVRTEQELASLDAGHQRDVRDADVKQRQAQARRDSLAYPLQRSLVTAPASGTVEAILLRRGDFIRSGQLIGKLLPDGAPLQVVSFVPEKDRAFVHPGDTALLELDQFPYTEFGTVKARVARVSSDLASRYELEEAMGEQTKLDAPSYRVELQLLPSTTREIRIKPGMLLHVRLTLRRQRLISMLFEPLAALERGE